MSPKQKLPSYREILSMGKDLSKDSSSTLTSFGAAMRFEGRGGIHA